MADSVPVHSDVVPARARSRRAAHRRAWGIAFLFVLPTLILFLIFRIGPAVAGVLLSLFDYSINGGSQWVGLDHYLRLFSEPLFWQSLKVTAIYSVIAVPLGIIVSTGMALLVRRSFRGSRFFRSVFFLPYVTSFVLAAVVFIWIFTGDGPWPNLMGVLGLPQEWLASSVLVLPAVAMVSVWKGFGYGMLIVLARLQDLPRELDEAAMADGAGAWQRFRLITLPQLKPALFFIAILETVGSFQVFDAMYVMTSGGPVHASYTLVYYLYDSGFRYFQFGYAAAIGVVLLIITLIVAVIQRYTLGRD